MDSFFEHIDSRAIFVIVMIAIGAAQAIMEKLRKAHAEREINEDLARRADQRSETLEPIEYDPPLDDLYEEQRREILERQQSSIEPEPPPPPLPDSAPPPLRPDTAQPTAPQPRWEQPAPAPRLSDKEQAAAKAFMAHNPSKRRTRRTRHSPVRRLLATRSSLRTAVVLKEILGTPKGLE
jgi:type IV secretory pathway VirB10-like protein